MFIEKLIKIQILHYLATTVLISSFTKKKKKKKKEDWPNWITKE